MNWKELRVEVNRPAGEALANILRELGAGGVIVDDSPGRVALTAYYPESVDFPRILSRVRERTGGLAAYGLDPGEMKIEWKVTSDRDWSTEWYKYFHPRELGERFVVSPSWEPYQGRDRIEIRIDPGMAFGVGSHETTRLSLEMLEKYLTGKGRGAFGPEYGEVKILDIGTGTGILAIAAAKLGFSDITGIDIDEAAVEAARENCRLNGVDREVKIIREDLTGGLIGTFSLIIANLLPDLIERLLPTVPRFLRGDGVLILSGITVEKKEKIISLLERGGFYVLEEAGLGDWVSLAAGKG